MIVIYTGNGKGKTSASVGQAVRALGGGLRVVFAQYMKRDGVGGEQIILRRLLGEAFRAGGVGFLTRQEDFDRHREAALELTQWALAAAPGCDMLVLDEALYALDAAILTKSELCDIIKSCETAGTHLVLSGRNLPAWLRDMADIVTEMGENKHAYAQGQSAVKGIEY